MQQPANHSPSLTPNIRLQGAKEFGLQKIQNCEGLLLYVVVFAPTNYLENDEINVNWLGSTQILSSQSAKSFRSKLCRLWTPPSRWAAALRSSKRSSPSWSLCCSCPTLCTPRSCMPCRRPWVR